MDDRVMKAHIRRLTIIAVGALTLAVASMGLCIWSVVSARSGFDRLRDVVRTRELRIVDDEGVEHAYLLAAPGGGAALRVGHSGTGGKLTFVGGEDPDAHHSARLSITACYADADTEFDCNEYRLLVRSPKDPTAPAIEVHPHAPGGATP